MKGFHLFWTIWCSGIQRYLIIDGLEDVHAGQPSPALLVLITIYTLSNKVVKEFPNVEGEVLKG